MKLTACSLSPLLDFYSIQRPLDFTEVFRRCAPVEVEIGFGMGEVLVKRAQEFPDRNFIGIEYNWERIFKTLKTIDRINRSLKKDQCIDNVRILRIDAWLAFDRLFSAQSIDYVYSLFPCPWPKKSHIKHRLFSAEFLKLINNRLTDGGKLRIVTDYYPYFDWIKEQNDASLFQLETEDIKPQFGTKFERKWLEEGQQEFFELKLLKNQHNHCTVKEDVDLKSYRIKNFDPDKFNFTDVKGDLAIVLKDKIYDSKREQMLVRVIISEQHLIQNFWAMIRKDTDFWRLCKMEGQHFFPTPGINKALEAIYEATSQGG